MLMGQVCGSDDQATYTFIVSVGYDARRSNKELIAYRSIGHTGRVHGSQY